MYEKLIKIFESYGEMEWLEIIDDILNYKSLDLPISINSEYSEDALIFINEFLAEREHDTWLKYKKAIIDFYTTLKSDVINVKKFETLHWVISSIKSVEYRYSLENKFFREDFLQNLEGESGERIQINLLACLGSLRYVGSDLMENYLFNRMNIYMTDSFILVSLRYFFKTTTNDIYVSYLNELISEKLNENNVSVFVESFKEYVYQNKSYQLLYLWYEMNYERIKSSNEKQFKLLQSEMRKWIHYENNEIYEDVYCELLFCELINGFPIPSTTLKNLSRHVKRIPLIKEKLKGFFIYAYKNFTHLTPYSGTIPYRIINSRIILDNSNITPELLNNWLSICKLKDQDSYFNVQATSDQIEVLKSFERLGKRQKGDSYVN